MFSKDVKESTNNVDNKNKKIIMNNLKFAFNDTSSITSIQPTPNKEISVKELFTIAKEGISKPDYFNDIANITIEGLYNMPKDLSDTGKSEYISKIKKQINPLKESLPWVLLSGYQEIGHNKTDIKYNGCIQIDIDIKVPGGDQLAKIIKECSCTLPYVLLAAISPSGVGVKIVVPTNNFDKSLHSKVNLQIKNRIIEDLKNEIDLSDKKINGKVKSVFDLLNCGQPCFVPYDTEVYFNENCVPFEVDFDSLNIVEEVKNDTTVGTYVLENENEVNAACRISLKRAFKEAFDDRYSTNVGKFYVRYCINFGVPKEFAIKYLIDNGHEKDFNSQGTKKIKALEYMYKKYSPESFGTWKLNIKSKILNSYKASANQYLTDLNITFPEGNFFLQAPTGMGKTYLVSTLLGKKIIIVPTTNLVEEISHKYGASPYYEKSKVISDFIVVTYSSFNTLLESGKIDTSEYDLYIDEAHNFTASASQDFLGKSLNAILSTVDQFNKYILLSATPLFNFHFKIKGLPVIKINKISNIKKSISVVKYVDRNKTIKLITEQGIKKGYYTAIFSNTTKDEGRLGTLKTLLKDFNPTIINSTLKESAQWNEIVIESSIPENSQVLITTSVLKEGISITKHNDTITIILDGQFNWYEIEQFSARFRNAKHIHVIVLQKEGKEYNTNTFNKNSAISRLEDKCLKLEEVLELSKRNDVPINGNTTELNYNINIINDFEVDYLDLSKQLDDRERMYLNNNIEEMFNILKDYGFIVLDEVTVVETLEEVVKDEIKEYKQTFKDAKTTEIEDIFHKLIKENPSNLMDLVDTKISNFEKSIIFKIIKVLGYMDNYKKAVALVKNNLTDGAFKQLIHSLSIRKVIKTIKGEDKKLKPYAFIIALYKEFKVGNTYEREFIKTKIEELKLNILGIKDKMNDKKLFNFMSCYLGFESKKTTKDGEQIIVYKIINNNPLGINYNPFDYTINKLISTITVNVSKEHEELVKELLGFF